LDKAVAVTNTTPVITLAGVGELRLLDALFERVLVPFEVWRELTDKAGATEPDQLTMLRSVTFVPAPPPPPEAAALHAGEAAAIAVAFAIAQRDAGTWLLLDDAAARRVADKLGLPVKGTLGVLGRGQAPRSGQRNSAFGGAYDQ
jgi:hypothetical protein